MLKRVRILFLIHLFVTTTSCLTISRSSIATPTPQPQIQKYDLLKLTSQPTLTNTPLPPSPSPSPIPASPTALPSASPTIVPTPSALQLRIFEELWNVVHDDYLYPDFNGLDWDAIRVEYRARIEAGLDNEAFYAAMDEMIYRLGDEHSVFLSPTQAVVEDMEFAGENDYIGIGIMSAPVPERDRVVIIAVFRHSPAEEAGLQAHDSILAIDGYPILDESEFRRDLLRGPRGTSVQITIQTPGQEPRQVTLTRRRVTGPVPVPYTILDGPGGSRVGYILMPTFSDDTIDDQVKDALSEMNSLKPIDALILDLRQNTGGADNVARNTLSFFTGGILGRWVNRHEIGRPLNVPKADIQGSSSVPIAILVGPHTVSFGELFAGVLKDNGRAYLIGERTAGNIELMWGYDFEDGSRAWIARETFRPNNHPDQDWERTGVIPDLMISSEWDLVTLGTDPVVQAALQYFENQSKD
jgi:carboxyl-terminal processing protease